MEDDDLDLISQWGLNYMKTKDYTRLTGKIKPFKLYDEVEKLDQIPKSKPSMRVFKSKKGLKALKGLFDIELNHNHSWYEEIRIRAQKDPDAVALFYRGTKISFKEMLERADHVAAALHLQGVEYGDTVPACLSNTPETVILLLAVNKLGARINLLGTHFNDEYYDEILNNCSNKVFLTTDDSYKVIKDKIKNRHFDSIVMSSLADSLPEDPTKCDEYEPELDKYYHYDNLVDEFKKEDKRIISFNQFEENGKNSNLRVKSVGDLDTEFLVTYTSGSTAVGHPSQIIHSNRSLIVSGRFHDSELSGNPDLKGLRGMAHIHTESNTDIITCISDNLMQLWSVALEPEYSKETALDTIFINKPSYLNMTTSHLIQAFKDYLIGRKFHEDGKGRKMPWLFACFAVGEPTSPGEEKFINKGLRIAKAGSGVKINGFSLPFTTLSIGGGDCEHGGIYYTLWKALFDKINYLKLKGQPTGMLPESYVQISAFKQLDNGLYEECDYGEYGIIASNSATTMVGYSNKEKTEKLIISDTNGRDWVSNNVYGYIDNVGGVHVKGRIGNEVTLANGVTIPAYVIEDVINKDTKNILSCTVNTTSNDDVVVNLEFQPDKRITDERVIEMINNRFMSLYNIDINKYVHYRIMNDIIQFPLTGAGKRSIKALEQMELNNTVIFDGLSNQKNNVYDHPGKSLRKVQ